MLVWLNGQFVPLQDAKISAFDAGFQHSVGLFETMHASRGRVFRIDAHLARLERSASELRLTERLHVDALRQAVESTLAKNDLKDARIRLTLTGGDLNLLHRETGRRPAAAHDPTILIHVQPAQRYPDSFFKHGVSATIANARLNPLDPFQGHKTLNYWPRLRALQDAAALGAGEALWFTVSNHLAGGSVSNVFLVTNEAIHTPIARGEEDRIAGFDGVKLPSPVLPGITRDTMLTIADERDLDVERRMLDIDDLLRADEVFLTNSSWGVLPVVQVERETIGKGTIGPVTRTMRDEWLKRVGGVPS